MAMNAAGSPSHHIMVLKLRKILYNTIGLAIAFKGVFPIRIGKLKAGEKFGNRALNAFATEGSYHGQLNAICSVGSRLKFKNICT